MAIPGARYVTRDVAPGTHIKAAVCIHDNQPPRALLEDAPRSPRALNDAGETATIAVAVNQLRSNQTNGGWSRKPVNRAGEQEQEKQRAKDDDEHEREHEDDNDGGGGDGDDNHDEDDDENDDE